MLEAAALRADDGVALHMRTDALRTTLAEVEAEVDSETHAYQNDRHT